MTIIEILEKNRWPHVPNGDYISAWCPFCRKLDARGDSILSFNIDLGTNWGECGVCHNNVKLDEWLEALEKSNPNQVKESPKKRRPNKQTSEDGAKLEQKIEECRRIKEEIIPKLKPLSKEVLIETLGLTIKHDEQNKLSTFLCQLSAYTKDSQLNLSYNAPSSTGKSFIPMEIAKLFPKEDIIELAYCSPTAFFHDGIYDEERDAFVKDYSRKIIIFLDQPHPEVLARLRPLLSHDQKEIISKITEASRLKTRTIILIGYPAVVFCTAGLHINEQEATRFLLLSPETSQEKIRESIIATIKKESDNDNYQSWLNGHPGRNLLKERILAIKYEKIQDIKIASPEKIEERFLKEKKALKPKNQRDIKRVIALVKCFALLNLWWRERKGPTVIADDDDIDSAFELWSTLSPGQELDLPPFIYDMYQEVILPAWREKNDSSEFETRGQGQGLSRNEIVKKHWAVYNRSLSIYQLSAEILPMLERAGLIVQEKDPGDLRQKLVYPFSNIVSDDKSTGKQ